MSYLTQRGQGSPLELFSTTTDASLASMVGSRFESSDGREFVLIQNGGVALVAGNLIQGPVSIGANHTGLTLSTVAIGSKTVTATLGATAVTANQYAGGFLSVSAGTGIGQTLRIASHPAAASSATVLLTLEDVFKVATLTSDSKGSLTLNPHGSANGVDVRTSGCVISPTTATGPSVGVTISPIAASTATVAQYGLIQTRGPVACLNISGTAIGLDVMAGSGTAGSVITYVVATRNRVGTSTVAGENAKCLIINLQL